MVKKAPRSIESLPTKAAAQEVYTAKPRGKVDAPKLKATFFMDRPVADELARIAVAKRTSQQQLLTEALSLWLSQVHGINMADLVEKSDP